MSNRRQFLRVLWEQKIILQLGKKRVVGELQNLSLNGACIKVKTPKLFEPGTTLRYDFSLTSRQPALHIRGLGEVVWRDRGLSIGVRFKTMASNDFEKLRHLIEYNVGNVEKIGKELKNLVRSGKKSRKNKQ